MFKPTDNSPFVVVMRALGDLLVLNMLWLLCSLPLVTLGATTSALYRTLFIRYRQNDFAVFKTFFKSLKENLIQGTLLELILLPIAIVASVDIWFGMLQEDQLFKVVFVTTGTIIAVIALIIITMGIPLLANFKNSIKTHIKNAFLLAAIAPGRMIEIWLIWTIPWSLILLDFQTFAGRLGFFYIMWGISGPAMATVAILQKVYLKCGVTDGQERLNTEAPDLWQEEQKK